MAEKIYVFKSKQCFKIVVIYIAGLCISFIVGFSIV
jgi:hypothetical protein